MNNVRFTLVFILASAAAMTATCQTFSNHYSGVPYHDSLHHNGAQRIPVEPLPGFGPANVKEVRRGNDLVERLPGMDTEGAGRHETCSF